MEFPLENECLQHNLILWENLLSLRFALFGWESRITVHQRQKIVPDLLEYFGSVSSRLDLMSIKAFMKNSVCGVHITKWVCFSSPNCEQI